MAEIPEQRARDGTTRLPEAGSWSMRSIDKVYRRVRYARQRQGVRAADYALYNQIVIAERAIVAFRDSYHRHGTVMIDMVATGADIRTREAVMFTHAVERRTFFARMQIIGVDSMSSAGHNVHLFKNSVDGSAHVTAMES